MRHSLLIPLIAFAALPRCAAAESSVTLYGVIDAGIEYAKSGDKSVSRLSSGGLTQSRFGLSGKEDLGNGLTAVFNLENRFNADDGTMVQGLMFGGRSIVGLTGRWGGVNLGRESNPIYALKAMSNSFGLAPYASPQVLMRGGATRTNNSVRYDSPVWAGLRMSAMYSLGTENPADAKEGRNTGASVQYRRDSLWLGLGWNRVDKPNAATAKTQEWLLGASYALGPVTGYLNHWRFNTDPHAGNGSNARVWTLSLGVKVAGSGRALASFGTYALDTGSAGTPQPHARLWLLGYEHDLSRRSTVYLQYARVNNRSGADFTLSGLANTQTAVGMFSSPHAVQAGFRHTF